MADGLARPKGEDDAYPDILKEKGIQHERAYLERLRAEGKSIVEIKNDPSQPTTIEEKAEQTRQAMADGAEVIYPALSRSNMRMTASFFLELSEYAGTSRASSSKVVA